MPPIAYPGNAITKAARAKAGGGFESAIEVATPGETITVTGSGFGSAPNVVLFRDFSEAASGSSLSETAPDGQIGDFSLISAETRCQVFSGRGVFEGFNEGEKKVFTFVAPQAFKRFRVHLSLAVPDGNTFPSNSAIAERTLPNESSIKPAWIMNTADGNSTGQGLADIVAATYSGSQIFQVSGNSVQIGGDFRYKNPSDDYFAWNEFNGFGYLQESDLDNPKTVNAYLENTMTSSKMGTVTQVRTSSPAFAGSDASITDANAQYDRINFNTFALNGNGTSQIFYSDLYLAIESEPNSGDFRQCLFLGNSGTFSGCSELRPVIADLWSDTEITFKNTYGLDFYHIVKPDGEIVSGATS